MTDFDITAINSWNKHKISFNQLRSRSTRQTFSEFLQLFKHMIEITDKSLGLTEVFIVLSFAYKKLKHSFNKTALKTYNNFIAKSYCQFIQNHFPIHLN